MSLSLWKKKIEKDLSEMKRAAPGSGRDNDSVWRQGKKKRKKNTFGFQGSECHCFYEKMLSEAFPLPFGCLNVFFYNCILHALGFENNWKYLRNALLITALLLGYNNIHNTISSTRCVKKKK